MKNLLLSSTAKDSIILFIGNSVSAVLGFLFIFLVGNNLSREDFGIFSAALNLVIIISSLSDVGITSGLVNFIAEATGKGKLELSKKYEKAGFVIRILTTLLLIILITIFAVPVSKNLLATNDLRVTIFVGVMSIALFVPMYMPFVLQAKKKFMQSMIVDNAFYFFRLIAVLIFIYFGSLTIFSAFSTTLLGFILSLAAGFYFLGFSFLKSRPEKAIYMNLIKFSGWIGVNRIISSVSGRLDVQMLAYFLGASATALYSIPARLSSFIIVIAGSFSSVLATRFASFNDFEKEKIYLKKATLALIPVTFFIILWAIFARFVMQIIFPGYLDAVPILQALLIAHIPFIITVPAVSAIIYAMKKTVYIGTLSFVQIALMFLLNYYLIPIYGPIGPTITLGITYSLLTIYVWWVVIKYYWGKK